jgi:hypothetical protein
VQQQIEQVAVCGAQAHLCQAHDDIARVPHRYVDTECFVKPKAFLPQLVETQKSGKCNHTCQREDVFVVGL